MTTLSEKLRAIYAAAQEAYRELEHHNYGTAKGSIGDVKDELIVLIRQVEKQ